MNLKNISSTLLLGTDLIYELFKTAILFAESGLNVWFISPEAFDKVPENIVAPDRQVLQLITFFYLKDYKDLLSHLNGIHLWHKIPDIIILSNLDIYCNLYCDTYNSLLSALVATTLLDSVSVCAKKKGKSCLILTCSHPSNDYIDRLQVLCDMYFPQTHTKSNKSEMLVNNIVHDYLSKKQSS